MQKELKLVEEFHKKFRVPVAKRPALISRDRADFRYQLMRGKMEKYLADRVKIKKIGEIAKNFMDTKKVFR